MPCAEIDNYSVMGDLTVGTFFCVRMPKRNLDTVWNLFHEEQNGIPGLKQLIAGLSGTAELTEAIKVASPDLMINIEKWLEGTLPVAKERKLIQSLYKYISRSGARSTPFGLFAGYGNGTIAALPSQLIFNENQFKVNTRLDMGNAIPLAHAISRNRNVFKQLRYFPNNSIYKINGQYRFFKYDLEDQAGFYQLTSVPVSEFLDELLTRADMGINYLQLQTEFLAFHHHQDAAENAVLELIEKQFLVSELYPKVTGGPFFEQLLTKIKQLDHVDELTADMENIRSAVKAGETDNENDHQITAILASYIPVVSKNVLQRDLFYLPEEAFNLNKKIADELAAAINDLIPLGEPAGNENLSEFKRRFKARYHDQMIPVLEVMDPLYGIGYGKHRSNLEELAPALKDLSIPAGKKTSTDFRWQDKHGYLLELLNRSKNRQGKKIVLDKHDILRLSGQSRDTRLPQNLYVLGNLLAKDPAEMDKGNYQFMLHHLAGPSAGTLVSRFCYASEKLSAVVEESLALEQNADNNILIAEVVHLPDPRMGNVVMRPVLRKYEIPLITRAGVGAENEIPLKDIMVSVKNDRIILYSKKFSKEISARITTAHNFTSGIPVYQFFGDLQFQGFNFFSGWEWFPFNHQPYLPRIEYGKLILKRARWLLSSEEYKTWTKINRDHGIGVFIRQKVTEYGIPDLVVLKEGDHELLLNLKSEICLSIISDELLHKDVSLYEFIFDQDNCIFKNGQQHFVHEIIIPLVTERSGHINTLLQPGTVKDLMNHQYNFSVGSEWLYLKIYTDYKSADQLIIDVILPLSEKLVALNIIDQWFYIRYKDPDHHIRLRFHQGNDPHFWKEVIDQFSKALKTYLSDGIVRKFGTDTYEQEVRRYGIPTMQLSEQLFHTDSHAVARLLSVIRTSGKEEHRLLLALKNIDMLLDDFNYSLAQKYQLTTTLSAYFYIEHNAGSTSKKLKLSLDQKYRSVKTAIDEMMKGQADGIDLTACLSCFHTRSRASQPVIYQLASILTARGNTSFLTTLLSSYIHMSMNRMFAVNQRQHELIVYHHLCKYYESQLAQKTADATTSFVENP